MNDEANRMRLQIADMISRLPVDRLAEIVSIVEPMLTDAAEIDQPIIIEPLAVESDQLLHEWTRTVNKYSKCTRDTFMLPGVSWLSRHLGRPAVVSDLTPENVLAAKRLTHDRHFRAVRALRYHAVESGLVSAGCYRADADLSNYALLLHAPRQAEMGCEAVDALATMLGRPAGVCDLTQRAVVWLDSNLPGGAAARRSRIQALCQLAPAVGVLLQPAYTRRRVERVEKIPHEIDGQLTVMGMFTTMYSPRRLLGKSINTTRLYQISIRKFGRWLGRPAMLSDLTDESVGCYIQYLLDESGNAPHTVEKEAVQLLTMWRYAAKRNMGPAWPEIRPPQPPELSPDSWGREELQQLLDACRRQTGTVSEIPAGLWWETLVRVILDTGERVGAVTQVKWSDLSGEWLNVRAELRKGKRKPKKSRLHTHTVGMLTQLRDATAPRDFVFPWDKNRLYMWKKFHDILQSAGLRTTRRDKFHKLRRTVATMFEQAGGDATKLLGHSSRKVTEACYLDESRLQAVQAVDLIEAI